MFASLQLLLSCHAPSTGQLSSLPVVLYTPAVVIIVLRGLKINYSISKLCDIAPIINRWVYACSVSNNRLYYQSLPGTMLCTLAVTVAMQVHSDVVVIITEVY